MNILVTGGLGFIGSHTTVALHNSKHQILILDNLSNSKIEVLNRLERILGKSLRFINGDIRDQLLLEKIMRDFSINAVIHFAGLKAVGESIKEPLMYYDNNVFGTISLLQAMKNCHINTLVFSSSATVYGSPQYLPIDENHPTNPESPYGQTKLQIENILKDLSVSDANWKIIALRYFNPIGAHESGLIGEEPNGIPNNLMPYIAKVAAGDYGSLKVFGSDYPTIDGTGVRDYIHVMDLADGHVLAIDFLSREGVGYSVFNLGTGGGSSVLELISLYESVSLKKIPYEFVPRRPGDIAICYANTNKAFLKLGWKATRDLKKMCMDSWRWYRSRSMR